MESAKGRNQAHLLTLGLFLQLATVACLDSAVMPPQRSVVDGKWQSECAPSDAEFPSHRIFLTLSATRFIERTDLYYHDASCQDQALAENLSGTYALSVSNEDNEYKMDMQFDAFDAVALSTRAERELQARRYCGLSQWAVGLPQNIALLRGAGCRSLGVLPIQNWNRVEVKPGTRLRFGAEIEHDNIRPEKVEGEAPSLRFAHERSEKP